MNEEVVLYEVQGPLALVTMNRPEYHNAQNSRMTYALDAAFRRACDWMGLQRHLKVIGIFARINYRDGKPHYLADVPRFIRYVREVATNYPELAPLLRLFDELGEAGLS